MTTALGNGEWTAVQVMRVLERLDLFVEASTSACGADRRKRDR